MARWCSRPADSASAIDRGPAMTSLCFLSPLNMSERDNFERINQGHATVASPNRTNRWKRAAAAFGLCLLSGLAAAQQRAGEISHLQGLATAQQPGGEFRFLERGAAVFEGDVIATTDKGYAVVSLIDGTKFTLRPSTTFALESFAHNQGTEHALMRLFKGGMRVITGLVGKRNPGSMQLRTSSATVGIRGTSFDARLCGDDCRVEGFTPLGASPQPGSTADPLAVIARIVQANGAILATRPGQPTRPVSVGAALYEGDDVRTGAGATAVIGFRDQTRVSVEANTALRLDTFIYNKPQSSDSMALRLFKGGMRVFTGLIARTTPSAVTVKTAVATLGIRGTGMDISCEGPCVDASMGEPPAPATPEAPQPNQPDGLFMFTWVGATFFEGSIDVPLNQTGFLGRGGVARLLASTPGFLSGFASPRPDTVQVDWENLFAAVSPTGADGLYVAVRDGDVFILSGGQRIDLGVGESGYAGPDGRVMRLMYTPAFLSTDPYPLPELFSQISDVPLLQLFGVSLGQPGQDMCRL